MVQAWIGWTRYGGITVVLRPDDRRAVDVHFGQQRLGCLPTAGRVRAHAGDGVHADGRLPPDRWRRSLGAAGAVADGQRTAAWVPAAVMCGAPMMTPMLAAFSLRGSSPADAW